MLRRLFMFGSSFQLQKVNNPPACPQCRKPATAPGLTPIFSEKATTVAPITLPNWKVYLCEGCGTMFGVDGR